MSKTCQFLAVDGAAKTPVVCDSVILRLEDGAEFELSMRRSDGQVTLDVGAGSLVVLPKSSNLVYLERRR